MMKPRVRRNIVLLRKTGGTYASLRYLMHIPVKCAMLVFCEVTYFLGVPSPETIEVA